MGYVYNLCELIILTRKQEWCFLLLMGVVRKQEIRVPAICTLAYDVAVMLEKQSEGKESTMP